MSTKRDILEISCKVLGLICLMWGLAYIPFAASAVVSLVKRVLSATDEKVPWSVAMIAIPVVQFISAFLLLKYSRGIASLLIREDGPVQVNVGEDWQRPVYTLCLRVVGAVVLVKGIPELIRVVAMALYYHRLGRQTFPNIGGQLISAIAYVVLGTYFIGGAKLIVRIALKGSMRESNSDNI